MVSSADMVKRLNARPFGAKWSRGQAQAMRREYSAGARYVDIEARWGVSRAALSAIIRGTYTTIKPTTCLSKWSARRK